MDWELKIEKGAIKSSGSYVLYYQEGQEYVVLWYKKYHKSLLKSRLNTYNSLWIIDVNFSRRLQSQQSSV